MESMQQVLSRIKARGDSHLRVLHGSPYVEEVDEVPHLFINSHEPHARVCLGKVVSS